MPEAQDSTVIELEGGLGSIDWDYYACSNEIDAVHDACCTFVDFSRVQEDNFEALSLSKTSTNPNHRFMISRIEESKRITVLSGKCLWKFIRHSIQRSKKLSAERHGKSLKLVQRKGMFDYSKYD